MFNLMLISIVLAPSLLGVLAARTRSRRRGVLHLIVLVAAYDVLYIVLLHFLRHRWVG